MTEAQFQTRITDLCDWLGLKWHHETDSRRSKAGYPDLTICGPSMLLFAELKTDKGKVSTEQREWLDALLNAGQHVYLWRPSHWPDIECVLKGMARGRSHPEVEGNWPING